MSTIALLPVGTGTLEPKLYFARIDFLLQLNISFDDVVVDLDR